MNDSHKRTRLFVLHACALLTACGGGSGNATSSAGGALNAAPVPAAASISLPATTDNSAAAAALQAVPSSPVSVAFTYLLPATASSSAPSQSRLHRSIETASNYTGYTSTSPAPVSINLAVTPVGGSTSNYTGSCTPAASGVSGICSVTFAALPGPTTFQGGINAAGNTIASFSQIQIIAAGSVNSISFTAHPIVASITLQLASTVITAGTPQDVLLTVNAKDANGNIIAGKAPYVDANGNAVAISLSEVNSQDGGKGTASIKGTTRIMMPGQATPVLHYDGNWLDHATVTGTANSSAVNMTGATATLTTTPHSVEYSTGISTGAQPVGICSGVDGNLWFTEHNQNKVGRVSTGGSVSEFPIGSNPYLITSGPDANLWVGVSGANTVSRVTTSGVITAFSTGISSGANPQDAATGTDGNLWFTEAADRIARVTTDGKVTEFSTGITSGSTPFFIVRGADGNLWFTELHSNRVGRITQRGIVTQFTAGITGGGSFQLTGLTAGQDGNLWFVEQSANRIGRITTAGAVTEFTSGMTAGANPWGITGGPDGNLWFTEQSTDRIARITPAGVITEFGSGITSGSNPLGITAGPDGNLWFTENSGNRIGKFVL